MKKITALILAIVMIMSSLMIVTAEGNTKINITADKTMAQRGDIIEFTVSIRDEKDIGDISISLDFDKESLEYVDSTIGPFLKEAYQKKIALGGKSGALVIFGMYSKGYTSEDEISEVCKFRMKVKEGAVISETGFTLMNTSSFSQLNEDGTTKAIEVDFEFPTVDIVEIVPTVEPTIPPTIEPPVSPTPLPGYKLEFSDSTELTRDGDTVSGTVVIDINHYCLNIPSTLILAKYSDGVLTGVYIKEIEGGTTAGIFDFDNVSIDAPQGKDNYMKAFYWHSLETQEPVTECAIRTIE